MHLANRRAETKKIDMNLIYINRDSDIERREEFLSMNSHISSFKRFSAIDGSNLDLEELVEAGVIERGLSYSRGAIGSALSHMFLWNGVQESGKFACIFEDDAILCENFASEAERVINALPVNWDIILFGCNSDTTLTVDMLPGVTPSIISFNQNFVQQNAKSFKYMKVSANPFKLIQTLGICGYAISPVGAKKFLYSCDKLRNKTFFHYGLNKFLKNTSIDHIMNNCYNKSNSYFTLPPLCITKNEHSKSTILI